MKIEMRRNDDALSLEMEMKIGMEMTCGQQNQQ